MKSKSFSIDSLLHKSATSSKKNWASYFSEHFASSDSTCLKSMFFGVSPKSKKNVQVAQHVRLTDKDVPI